MDVRLHLLIWSTLAFLCVCGLEEGKHAAPRTIERPVGEHAVADTCFSNPTSVQSPALFFRRRCRCDQAK